MLQAADDEPLQIQLRGNAQVHGLIERIVVRDERARRRPARDGLHHRRLDFEEIERLEGIAQVADDCAARAEHGAARLVHHQIDVALAVARLGVGKPVPLVGQRPEGLDQQLQAGHAHSELTGAGAKQRAHGAHNVADIVPLERLVGRPEGLFLQEQLDRAAPVGELRETRLAHQALEHHAAADAHPHRIGLEPGAIALLVGAQQIGRERITPEIIGKGRPLCAQRRQLGAALGDQPVFLRLGARRLYGRHNPAFRLASMN